MRLLLISIVTVLAGCATTQASAPPPTTASTASPVVARYNGKDITLEEVDRRAGDDFFELQDKLYELRTDTAERMALEALVTEKAKKAGVAEEEWVQSRVDKGVPEPTDEELQALFDKLKDRLEPGTEFESIKPQLKMFAMRDVRAHNARALFDKLKKEANYAVVLDAPARPRRKVEAVGPSRGGDTSSARSARARRRRWTRSWRTTPARCGWCSATSR